MTSPSPPKLDERRSGVLCHVTSLPGPFPVGDVGPAAHAFVDFLAESAQSWWQTLPVVPTGAGNSPYGSPSAFAGNPLLVSLEALGTEGLLEPHEIDAARTQTSPDAAARVDFGAAYTLKERALRLAQAAFERGHGAGSHALTLEAFREANAGWLPHHALYMAIKEASGGKPWTQWDEDLRLRRPEALARAAERLAADVRYHEFVQWVFERQWAELRAHAASRGVGLLGDLPIFVALDSADVWAHPELFELGADGLPSVVAGIPPDYFSAEGQLWGNPLYRWDALRARGYDWWLDRLRSTLNRFDAVRIDHFIGFVRYWEVAADAKTAVHGRWREGPADDFFRVVREALGTDRLVAEDLGLVTEAVKSLRDRFELPGMRVLEFAFSSDDEDADYHRPHTYPRRAIAYTGTHDNDTLRGWLDSPEREASRPGPVGDETVTEREVALAYAGCGPEPSADVHWDFLRLAWISPANVAIAPVQDVLGLGTEARMNTPGRPDGNWEWRVDKAALTPVVARRLRALTVTYGRARRARREAEVKDEDDAEADGAGPDGSTQAGRTGAAAAGRSRLTPEDLHYFNEGTHVRLYDCLGAHPFVTDGKRSTSFGVWAPDASRVSVVGDWNGWVPDRDALAPRGGSGIWEGTVAGVGTGALYKYHVVPRSGRDAADKADPLAFRSEVSPRTASIVTDLAGYGWGDAAWLGARAKRQTLQDPISVYEVHLGSWMRVPGEGNRSLTYRELAPLLADYVERAGFTHVELLPVMEHPFFGSWGYQVTGYFAASSRQGSPHDLMFLIDTLHARGIGVILDWVPSHFPSDAHGLASFDGTHLYEHADPRQGFHPDWKSLIFNYGRNEVRSFLLSSAHFWLDVYHADGLRVDGVASMLYLDYSRKHGEWIPNIHGGRENLGAILFLRKLNESVAEKHPGVITIAEESTSWPMCTRPVYLGGLGFTLKWDMGWMHDTLRYLAREPIHRSHHHNEITFRTLYAFHESFVLALSHDEVVHGKRSLLGRMPGDRWQQLASLRLLLAYQLAQPGKKLLFMGGELASPGEWDHDASLDWSLLADAPHAGVLGLVGDLNRLYRAEQALHERDCEPDGFSWVDANDSAASVLTMLRFGLPGSHPVLVALNFTPVVRERYRIGAPLGGPWTEVLNTDAAAYGGSNVGNLGSREARSPGVHGRPFVLEVTLPPLGAVFFRAPAALEAKVPGGEATRVEP